MFKKKEAYVSKANRQLLKGETPEALRTVLDGLDDYQQKIIRAVCPYPTADTALLVITLRYMADALYYENPDCHGLVKWIAEKIRGPQMVTAEKVGLMKKR